MANSPEWVTLGLDMLVRAERYSAYNPGEHDRDTAFVAFEYLGRIADEEAPSRRPWWWIHAKFLQTLLSSRSGGSIATWATLGRIANDGQEEWINFYSQDFERDTAAEQRFRRVASVLAHPDARTRARDRIYLLTLLLHDLMKAGTDSPPVAFIASFDGNDTPRFPNLDKSIRQATFPRYGPRRTDPFSGCECPAFEHNHGMRPVKLHTADLEAYLQELAPTDETQECCQRFAELGHIPELSRKLAAWARWVHDLSNSVVWSDILAVSANPAHGRPDYHPSALVVYLRTREQLREIDIESCVLSFRAGALASYDNSILDTTFDSLEDRFRGQFASESSFFKHHAWDVNSFGIRSGKAFLDWLRGNIPSFQVDEPESWDTESSSRHVRLYDWMKGGFGEGQPIYLGTLALLAAFTARTCRKDCEVTSIREEQPWATSCLFHWNHNMHVAQKLLCLEAFDAFVRAMVSESSRIEVSSRGSSLILSFTAPSADLGGFRPALEHRRAEYGKAILGMSLPEEDRGTKPRSRSLLVLEWLSKQVANFPNSPPQNFEPGFLYIWRESDVTLVALAGVPEEA